MTPATIRAAGEFLYGARWQTALAKAIGVSPQAVRAWIRPNKPTRPSHASETAIRLLLERKQATDSLFE